jgi:aspartyl protease family protein
MGDSLMKRPISCLCILLAALALGLAPNGASVTRAQDKVDLVPLFGETKAEFEARKSGLPRPTAPPEPYSLTFAANASGHFLLEPTINGTRIRMLLDTGATSVVLTQEDAHRIGINPSSSDFTYKTATANGILLVAPVLLREIAIGEISMRNVQAVVPSGNKLNVSLLGMSFLSKLTHFEVSGGKLILKR